MNKIIYYRSPKVGSSSIVGSIERSGYSSIHLNKHSDLSEVLPELGKYQIIIVGHGFKTSKEDVDPILYYKRLVWFLEVQNALDKLENCKSFAISRDPYSKFVSSINYCGLSNEQLLKMYDNNLKLSHHNYIHILRTQTDTLSYNGRVFADKIIKYENFDEVSEFFRSNGFKINIPHINKTKKKLQLDKQMVDFVNQTYSEDFKNFGYKLEE